MAFAIYDKTGKIKRNAVVLDCSNDPLITEQSHKSEVDINNIIRRHGVDMIAKAAALQAPNMRFDDVTGNDFQEAMNIILKAEDSFNQLPSKIRKEFNNNPAEFLDFVQNPDNKDRMIELGLAEAPPVKEAPSPDPAPVPAPDPAPTE